ncbi:hypothetical protein ACJX0J_037498, partial [Zea mays]
TGPLYQKFIAVVMHVWDIFWSCSNTHILWNIFKELLPFILHMREEWMKKIIYKNLQAMK